ncbi:uncharacterized protein C8Q71DRAFT_700482, partial [Rhodofomes roseus]
VPVKSSKIAIPVPEDNEKMHIQDRRGIGYDPLVQPSLRHENKLRPKSQKTIAFKILASQDDRVLAIVGPCSIHSPSQAIEYATLLKSKMPEWSNLHIIMRAYLCARSVLAVCPGVFALCGGPVRRMPRSPHCETIRRTSLVFNRILTYPHSEVRHWPALSVPHTLPVHLRPHLLGAIGARTTESQLHHELASSVSFPIGCKNGKDGSVAVPVDAMCSSSNPRAFMGARRHRTDTAKRRRDGQPGLPVGPEDKCVACAPRRVQPQGLYCTSLIQ